MVERRKSNSYLENQILLEKIGFNWKSRVQKRHKPSSDPTKLRMEQTVSVDVLNSKDAARDSLTRVVRLQAP